MAEWFKALVLKTRTMQAVHEFEFHRVRHLQRRPPMSQVLNAIATFNWLEAVKTAAPVATAIIAFTALRNWQRQDKAKREAEFLDVLVEAANGYIADLPAPIQVLEIAKIGIASHAPTWQPGEEAAIAVKSAIAFIEKDGERVGKRLLEALATTRSSVIKLRSLAAKGQVFNFKNYEKCQNAVRLLTWQFDRMEGFAAYISMSSWYWENPEVIETLKRIMSIDAGEVRRGVQDSHAALLEFGRASYKQIYG